MTIKILKSPISKKELETIAKNQFGDLVKAVVDIELGIIAIGGELHADEEAALIEHESKQKNLWGINLLLGQSEDNWIEFDSMINLRPSEGNRSRSVENEEIRNKIRKIISGLILK